MFGEGPCYPEPVEIVWLTPGQQAYADHIANARRTESSLRALPNKHGFTGDGLAIDLLGARGEAALAAWLFPDQDWELTVNTFHTLPDLPGHIEVRTCTRSTYRLIIRKTDDPDAVYVLVAQAGAAWWLRGWLRGSEVQEEWLAAPGGREEAYFVPHHALRPMEELRAYLDVSSDSSSSSISR